MEAVVVPLVVRKMGEDGALVEGMTVSLKGGAVLTAGPASTSGDLVRVNESCTLDSEKTYRIDRKTARDGRVENMVIIGDMAALLKVTECCWLSNWYGLRRSRIYQLSRKIGNVPASEALLYNRPFHSLLPTVCTSNDSFTGRETPATTGPRTFH